MKFVFLLTCYLNGNPTPIVSVVDYNLTAEDCIQRMESYRQIDPNLERSIPSCEFDQGVQE